MVKLSDYIGLILSELTTARVQADIESLRMAELYSTNKVLKNFAVPRVRFQNVEITTPVVIDKADEAAIEESRKPLKISEVRGHVDEIVAANLNKRGITLSANDTAMVKKALDDRASILERQLPTKAAEPTTQPPGTVLSRPTTTTPATRLPTAEIRTSVIAAATTDTKSLADEFTSEVNSQLRKIKASQPELMKNVDLNSLAQDVKNDLRVRLINARPPPPSLQVLINTAQIKEAGPKEAITLLKFVITEDAMEWTEYQTGAGETKEQLVPE